MENPPRGLPGLRPDPWSLLLLHLDLASGPWGGMALLRRVTPPRGRGTSPRRHLVAGLVPPTAVSLSSTATPAFTSAGALGQTFSQLILPVFPLGCLAFLFLFYLASLYVFTRPFTRHFGCFSVFWRSPVLLCVFYPSFYHTQYPLSVSFTFLWSTCFNARLSLHF